jgi:lipid-A-disaccharide synthase-like uncharacterized protein
MDDEEDLQLSIILALGVWLLNCAVRSFKRGYVYKEKHGTKKFYKDEDPFGFWLQIILGGGFGSLLLLYFIQRWIKILIINT